MPLNPNWVNAIIASKQVLLDFGWTDNELAAFIMYLKQKREAVAKGMKLLEALAEPHKQPDGNDHAWRTCRRCLALEEGETEHARQLFRALLDELEILRKERQDK